MNGESSHGAPSVVLWAASLILLWGGTALLPFPMLGLLGIPATIMGAILLIRSVVRAQRASCVAPWQSILGLGLIVSGVSAMVCVAFMVSINVHYELQAFSRGIPANLRWAAPVWWGLWIAGPSLIVLALRLRSKWNAAMLILAWIGCAALAPLVYLTVQVLGEFLPLSA